MNLSATSPAPPIAHSLPAPPGVVGAIATTAASIGSTTAWSRPTPLFNLSTTTTTTTTTATTLTTGSSTMVSTSSLLNGTKSASGKIDCAKECPCGGPVIPVPDQWLEVMVTGGFKVWHIIFIIIAFVVTTIVVYCCFHRCRIPRTKQEIEADLMRMNITNKFRDYLQEFPNEPTTFIEALKKVQEMEEKSEKDDAEFARDSGARKRMGWLKLKGKGNAQDKDIATQPNGASNEPTTAATEARQVTIDTEPPATVEPEQVKASSKLRPDAETARVDVSKELKGEQPVSKHHEENAVAAADETTKAGGGQQRLPRRRKQKPNLSRSKRTPVAESTERPLPPSPSTGGRLPAEKKDQGEHNEIEAPKARERTAKSAEKLHPVSVKPSSPSSKHRRLKPSTRKGPAEPGGGGGSGVLPA